MKENNEINNVLLESFNELGINYNNGEKALSDIEGGFQTIDQKRNEVKLYFEYLMRNTGKTKDDIQEVLNVQKTLIMEMKKKIYSLKSVTFRDQISANIIASYMNGSYSNITIINETDNKSFDFLHVNDLNYLELELLYKLFLDTKKNCYYITSLDNGTNINDEISEYSYLMGPNRTLN